MWGCRNRSLTGISQGEVEKRVGREEGRNRKTEQVICGVFFSEEKQEVGWKIKEGE